ncbi:RNA polymerase sigma factor [Butyrivibrio sp. AC2005]|uniref:RNA polymerase sigma factor n=1 Tax=Butyrivibrio sp. AC2005 TaxID=1280672 RepID=UPI000426F965|nr:sigma-70 family RNA polymerase sigma factor [Butyrivibrio sp. AC2005]
MENHIRCVNDKFSIFGMFTIVGNELLSLLRFILLNLIVSCEEILLHLVSQVDILSSTRVSMTGIFEAINNDLPDDVLSKLDDTKEKASDLIAKNTRVGLLLDKYGNNILRIAYVYLHNMSDAEDILQDTLIQYIRKAPPFENDAHEKAWLYKVAANLSKNKIAYLSIRKTDELSENLVAEEKDDLAFVWEAVKQLSETFREVVHLFYHEGYSTRDIAGILNRNESTVRSDLKRAREQLKKILKEAYDFD